MQETPVQSLGQEDPLGKEVATYSSILAWKIPWTRGACQGMVHGVAKSPCMHTHGVLRPETKDLSDALLSTSGPSDSPCWA